MQIGVTGHRPQRLGGYGVNVINRLDRLCREALDFYEPSRVALGMAQGFDMAMGFACVAAGVPFDAYIPFAGQCDPWPAAAQERYDRLLARAAMVTVCTSGGYDPAAMQIRNMAIVDASDIMLTLWDGSRHGGTWNCLEYATSRRAVPVPVCNLWLEWQRLGGH